MEDGQGDVGPGVSELPSSETLVENMGSENKVEGSYDDGEEIMVEIVGSDVFVDGVSGDQVADLEGHVTESGAGDASETMDVSSGGGGNDKIVGGDVGLAGSRDARSYVVEEKVENSFSESVEVGGGGVSEAPKGVGVLDDEVWNPGIEATVVSTSAAIESTKVQGEVLETSTVVISEEKGIKDGEDGKGSSDVLTPGIVNHPEEAVDERKGNVVEKDEEKITSSDTVAVHDQLETNPVTSDESTDGTGAKSVDEHENLASECMDSILKDALVSNVRDEAKAEIDGPVFRHDKSLVSRSEEVKGMEIDDLKGGTSGSKLPDSSCVNNDESLKIDEDLKTDAAHQNREFSDEPTQLADECDTVEANNDKGLDFEIQVDTEKNQPMDIVHDADQSRSAASGGDAINGQNVTIPEVEGVDGDGSSGKAEEIAPEIPLQSLGNSETPAPDASTENVHLSAEAARSKVGTADVDVETDCVAYNDTFVNAEVGLDNFVEEEASVQISETPNDGSDKLEGIDPIPSEVASTTAVSDTVVNVESWLDSVVEERGSVPGNAQQVSMHIAEPANQAVDKLESMDFIPDEVVAKDAAVSDIDHVIKSQEIIEKVELHVSDMAGSTEELNKSHEAEDLSCKSNGYYVVEDDTSEAKPMDVDNERESDQNITTVESEERESGIKGPTSENDQLKLLNEETEKHSSHLKMNQSGYLLPQEQEGQFGASDLVWGKVRSHPWWPGQIFDPTDASEKSVKHYKKDSYLVAYFGDGTFAWNDASVLKPFRSHFYQIEKQSNSEAFQNAVTCALEEVSRRVELGLACSCIPKDAYGEIETQVVENAGIREESSVRYGLDQSSRAVNFEPDKLLEYVRELAPRASAGADRLDLVIARAQLSAFSRFKGYPSPPEFSLSGELLENDDDTEKTIDEMVASNKRKRIPSDSSQSRKKERSLMELMDKDAEDESVVKDSLGNASDRTVSVYGAKVSTSTNPSPKPSFKIGECISKVAIQLTGGATTLVKCNNSETGIDGSQKISAESASVNEILSQLQLVAQDPKKGNFVNGTRTFFLGFRSSISLTRRGRKKKADTTVGGSAEEFEFDDVNDSYWTDRIVQNYSEEQLLHNGENGDGNLQVVPFSAEKPVKPGRRPYSRKRFSTGNSPMESTELEESAKRRKQESSPAELILNFAERNCLPSEINLNKIFRRFGPLMESETEVDHDSGRAKVIFKRGSDAEVAHNSAEKFNIFGPVLVNYQIGYSPLISVKISPLAVVPQYQEDATIML